METLEIYSQDIKRLCTTYKVKTLYIFGSVLSEKFTEKSDIDFIVDFESIDLKNYADNYFNLKFSLEDVFNRTIDLIEAKAIKNPYFKQSLESQRKLIYGY